MMKLKPAVLFVGLSFALAGCGGDGATNNTSTSLESASDAAAAQVGSAAPPATANAAVATLSDGPDVCFRAIAKHLGADVKVSEILSFFSEGSEIDSSDSEPQGQMTTCSVQYQNPNDPRKLLGASMDMKTGAFGPPSPVEITVSGGDAAAFKLDDYLVPLSKVNAAGLKAIMDSQAGAMSGIYSKYAWSGVRLESPGAFSDTHTLRLDLEGRLASNDIKKGGYASVSLDGKTVTKNFLKP